MRLQRLVVFATLLCATAAAYGQTSDFSGTWTGTLTEQLGCPGGGSVPSTLSLTANFTQSANAVTGTGVGVVPKDACNAGTPIQTAAVTFSGSAIGSALSGTWARTGESGSFSATLVTSSSMNFTFTFPDGGKANGVMTRSAAGPPSVDVTGSWGGTFNANETCISGNPSIERPIQWSSPATLVVVQQQGTVSGAIIIYAVPDRGDQCQVLGTFPVVLPVSGQVSGSALSGAIVVPNGTGSFTASISGNSMSVNVSAGTGFSASATLTRGSSQVPDIQLSGSYSGSYSSVFTPCPESPGKLPPIQQSGSISGPVTQVGPVIYGPLTITGLKNDHYMNGQCTVTDEPPQTVTMSGQVSGNSISGLLFVNHSNGNDDETVPFTATISGNTITGTLIESDPFTFSITRAGSTAPPPQILSFTATPPSIRSGQAVTLSWSTNAATSVTIDNGVGGKPASSSINVAPTTTTTYTLAAMQGTQTATASVTVEVLSGPIVNLTTIPATMLQVAGSGASTSYALTNSGSASSTVTLGQSNNFFTQSPASFTLAPGATQVVTIAATSQPVGAYEGTSNPSGSGVPSGLQIPVKLVSAYLPAGIVTADAAANRVDVAASPNVSPSGSVSFKNNGTSQLIGVLNSDVPWLIPQSGTVTINPGQTVTLTFSTDRSKRPDASSLVGSTEGSLTLSFLSGRAPSAGAKRTLDVPPPPPPVPSISLVKVVDTVQPVVTTAGIPAIAAGDVALFVAGVGHTVGTRGSLFVSDVSFSNPQGSKSIDDAKLYYLSTTATASASRSTSLPSVPGQVSVSVADVVKNVFSGTEERGTLQIRSKDADKLAVAATVLTTNNPAGTFGNTIPVFRSDRSIDTGSSLVLSDVRKDSTTHTNLYLQETGGFPASVQSDFQAADGSTLITRTDSIDPFKLLALDDVVPANAVAVVVTNKSTAGGRIAGYATPVDEASGDTWAIADWSRQLGYSGADPVVIPIAGSVHGRNNTFYRTDLVLTNRGSNQATGTLRYVARSGETAGSQLTLAGKETRTLNDVVGSFNLGTDTVGFLTFTPTAGAFAASSRTFTTLAGKADTFGASVPVLSAAAALRRGGTRPIGGLSDASAPTVLAAKPSTYRTNFALMETSGTSATVRVTFRFNFPAGQKAQGAGSASRDYVLSGNQFVLLNSIANEILGSSRLQFGDLTNLEADFQVVDGNGAVMLFTSSVDNATGDSILRTD